MRDGLRASRIRIDREILQVAVEPTILAALIARFPTDEQRLREKADAGEFFDDAGEILPGDSPARPGTCVHVFRDPPEEEIGEPQDLPILHCDKDIIVVDKPHRMATAPRGQHVRHTALVQLRRQTGETDLAPAHRLDRLTAGVLIFTRHRWVRRDFQLLFQERRVRKEYLAIADPPADSWEIMERTSRIIKPRKGLRSVEMPGPDNAHTVIELAHRGADTLYRLRPTTGRTHQLRVHMNALGLPIRSDPLYPNVIDDPDTLDPPLQLLAAAIEFEHPITGETVRYSSGARLALDPRPPHPTSAVED